VQLAATLDQLNERGYAILERAIDAALVAEIKRELAPYLQGRYPGRNDFEGLKSERVYALLAKAPSIAALIEHTEVLAVVDAILPPHYLLSAALAIQVHPGEKPQAFHIDDSGNGLPLAAPRPPLGVSTMWAIDDFTETNGATEIVPGSHRWNAPRAPTEREIVKAVMPAGSVCVFLGNVLHRGGANRSAGSRLGITPQYCAPVLRQIENMVLAVPPDIAGRYSARVQALLGYSVVEPGFMGYVDGRHPRKLIPAATPR